MLMLFENDRERLAVDRDMGVERVRLRNFVDRFQETATVGEREVMPRAVRPHGLDRNG